MAEVNQQQVIDYIKGISVMELSALVKALESELGVSAAAAMPMAMPMGGGAAAGSTKNARMPPAVVGWGRSSEKSGTTITAARAITWIAAAMGSRSAFARLCLPCLETTSCSKKRRDPATRGRVRRSTNG